MNVIKMKTKLIILAICPVLFLLSFNKKGPSLPRNDQQTIRYDTGSSKGPAPSGGVYKDSLVTNFFNRTAGWIASDGAITIPLANGSVLWLMCDGHINDYDKTTGSIPCLFQVRNCGLLQPANDWQWQHTKTLFGNGYKGSQSLFKFYPDDEHFSWPGAGVQIKDTIYVYCSNLKKTGDGGTFGFGSAGPDRWAKIKFPEMKVTGYMPLQSFGDKNFGYSMIKDEVSGYVYVYGEKMTVIKSKIYVARFPIKNPNTKWTFYDGSGWSVNVSRSVAIGDAPSNDVSMCRVKNKYLSFSTQFSVGCDQGKEIYVATGNNPVGPFSAPKTIYTIPDNVNGHSPFFYGICGHPEFTNSKDELLVTYDINGYGNCVTDCVNGRSDPNIYRPRGIRVPLKLIDPAL